LAPGKGKACRRAALALFGRHLSHIWDLVHYSPLHCCDKIPKLISLWGRKFYLGSQLQRFQFMISVFGSLSWGRYHDESTLQRKPIHLREGRERERERKREWEKLGVQYLLQGAHYLPRVP
jgi:hypothetical protein